MKRIIVDGPAKLGGRLKIQGSKNAALVNLVAALLTDDDLILENIPHVSDVEINLSIIQQLGAKVDWTEKNTLVINCRGVTGRKIDRNLAFKTTTSKFFIPVLVERFGEITTGQSHGDKIGGDRGFADFLGQMNRVGIEYLENNGEYKFFKSPSASDKIEINLDFPSYSATISLILFSVLGGRSVTITNANQSELLDNFITLIQAMGANLKVAGRTIEIYGVPKLAGVKFKNLSDHNALVTYLTAGLITNSALSIVGFDNNKLDSFWAFLDGIGADYNLFEGEVSISPCLEKLKPTDLRAYIYPQFHSDWQPLVAPLMTQVSGQSSITDDLWTDRLAYWEGLGKMGAKYELFEPKDSRFHDGKPHGVKIVGPVKLVGCDVSCPPDIRGSASLVLAALAARGRSIISNTEHLERGYEDMVGTLKSLGAKIDYES